MERQIQRLFRTLKTEGAYLDLPPADTTCPSGDRIALHTVSMHMPNIEHFIVRATAWRNAQTGGFFSEFVATEERTRLWLRTAIEDNPTRIMFLVENHQGFALGHLGLRYDSIEGNFEVENILRGKQIGKGCMTTALSALCAWTFRTFPVTEVFLRSFADNTRALAMYKRCSFEETARWSVFRQVKDNGDVVWCPITPAPKRVPRRVVVCMRTYRKDGTESKNRE